MSVFYRAYFSNMVTMVFAENNLQRLLVIS